jgi:hypothetical protein
MDVRLHQRQVFSPLIPPARGNGRDVAGVAQCPALEVLTADERRAGAHSLQHKEAPEQPHRWPYPTYISQRLTKMTTRAMELGERCCSWSL